ncbi:MAG: NTP transferase domain-containing protein [Fimbriimonas sp.]|nr:NTP transferase domain-containing protein [Fimbriimonas sp.]
MLTFDAILPAGGLIGPEFAAQVGTSNKALIQFGDKTILERTIASLRETGRVGRIVVAGSDEVRKSESAKLADLTVASGRSGPESILNGLKALLAEKNPPAKVVVATTDLPFLTPKLVTDFIDTCPPNVDLCMPLITKSQYQARFPHSHSTFIPLKDDTWTAGNVYLIDVKALESSMPHLEKVFLVRKSKLGMAKMLGPIFLYRFLRKQLTVPMVEAKIKQMLGCTGAPVLNCAPELAYDIDALDDYEYALKHLVGN